METQISNKIACVPAVFKQPDHLLYPEDNSPDFESWFAENIKPEEIPDDWIYLPIFFTAYFKRNKFGADKRAIKILQDFINSLDRTKRYFTIVQYDDGTLIDFRDLNVRIFAMSGKPEGSVPIPLVSQPHTFTFPNVKKDILCSFVGRNTHPLRRTLIDQLSGRKGFFVTDKPHSLKEYCNVLAKSVFSLCPRGYGLNSFRIGESLQYGAIPIIITDDRAYLFETNLPFKIIHGIGRGFVYELEAYLHSGNIVCTHPLALSVIYREGYTFEGVKKYILENISSC